MSIPVGAHSCEEMCTPVDSAVAGVSGGETLRGRNTLAVLVEGKWSSGWGKSMLKTTVMVAAVAEEWAGVDDFRNQVSIATNLPATALDPALVSRFRVNGRACGPHSFDLQCICSHSPPTGLKADLKRCKNGSLSYAKSDTGIVQEILCSLTHVFPTASRSAKPGV
jgi:hypothetical protein